jgi:hypothetical protein
MNNAPRPVILELPKFERRKKDDRQQPKRDEPLPWHEGEPDRPTPPFLPAA